jgi:protein-disulfide isomerase
VKTICAIVLFCLFAISPSSYAELTTFSPAQQSQIQTIVRDYLLKNPQILMEMAQRLQQNKIEQVVNANVPSLFFSPTSPVLGNARANVTVVTFLDYQCPHCKHVAPFINKLVSSDANVRVIVKELPIFGEISEFASRAALAARLQNKYPAFHAALMQAKAPFTQQQILDIAKSVGLNIDKLKSDMNSDAITQEIKTTMQLASALNLAGTPAFIIVKTPVNANSKIAQVGYIPGDTDFTTLRDQVNALRAKTT